MHVALAALISACRAVEDEGEGAAEGLRATLPLAGGTLVEYQARLAAAAGAVPIVILVERLPASLTAAIDRLRQDGLRVEVARGLADAIDRIHPDEALLLLADGCVADAKIVARMAAAPLPAMLTVPDDADHARFERIDATDRWGGLLLIDGARLRRTAAKLGDWDLESTLLRRTVQESAARIGAFDQGDASLVIADGPTALEPLDRALLASARSTPADWPARFIFPPIVGIVALPLLRRGVQPKWAGIAAVALSLIAVPFALYGWRWTALLLLLGSGPLMAVTERLAEVRLMADRQPRRLSALRAAAATAVLVLLGLDLAASQGWGCWLLALIVPLAMAGLARERRILGADHDRAQPIWLASLDGLIWLFLPAAIAGSWLGGIGLAAGYAAGSFAMVQQWLLRDKAEV